MNTNLMKKRTNTFVAGGLFALTLMALPVHGLAKGNYVGLNPSGATIQEAITKADDTFVTLKGNIISQEEKNIFTFQDASGKGLVEIDRNKLWKGQTVTPEDSVELIVKVKKDMGKTELDVKDVRVVSDNSKQPFLEKGGFAGPGPATVTVKDAATKADDTWVTLQGKLVSKQDKHLFVFQDASGEGIVEIDRKGVWNGQKINQNDSVELLVKVKKSFGDVTLDVKKIRVLS